MNPLRLIVKVLWRLRREAASAWRMALYRGLPGTWFESVGPGTKFYGTIRFGNIGGNIRLGANCMMGADLFLSATNDSRIVLGNDVSVNTGGHIVSAYGIEIGDGTRIGEYVTIRDQNHAFEDPARTIVEQGFTGGPIRIGRDVWVGRGVVIAANVTIGDGCVIGANSVVTRSLEPFSVAVGSPAKAIRKRGDRQASAASAPTT